MKKYIIFIIALLSMVIVHGQNKHIKKANESFHYGEYSFAIDLLKKAYSETDERAQKVDIVFKIAECYRKIHNSESAEEWYGKAIAVKHPNKVCVLYQADAQRMNGKFEEAISNYNAYKQLVPDDERAEIGIKSCHKAQEWMNNPTRYIVENRGLFNSKGMDFSPSFAKKDNSIIVYTSTREESTGKKTHRITGQDFADIYMSTRHRSGKWGEPVLLPGIEVNTTNEEGTPCVNKKGNALYFARCNVEKNEICGCQIHVAKKKGASWGNIEKIPIANDTIVVSFPSISANDLVLYFSADMEGGQGGRDIWMIKRERSTKPWGDPINLGSDINTPGDEIAPFIREDGRLYFSSNYRVGLGGMDIYVAESDDKGNWYVKNMQYPVNSVANDYGIIFEGNKEKGYLTSTRKGGMGFEDIYTFELPPIQAELEAFVKNEDTDEPIQGAEIKVCERVNGDTVLIKTLQSELDGSFRIKLQPSKDYYFYISKDRYLNSLEKLRVPRLDDDTVINKYCLMVPVAGTKELKNILYDFASAKLQEASLPSLQELVDLLNNNPEITIELSSHTDHIGNDEDNMKLSQARAKSVVDFLIEKGIDSTRLIPKGYGESVPYIVDMKTAALHSSFLMAGDVLSESFIEKLDRQQQIIARKLNRRTEFKVIEDEIVGQK
jgi:peptidoglycan-associated lipoprotein